MEEYGFEAECPHYKETCVNGHTKSMGHKDNGMPRTCVYLASIKGKDPQGNREYDQKCCGAARQVIMSSAINQSIVQLTASVDRNGNMFFKALPQEVKLRLIQESQAARDLIDLKQKENGNE